MGFFSAVVEGVADEIGIKNPFNKAPDQIGRELASNAKDAFRGGISRDIDKHYGMPTGDAHAIVTKKNTSTPAVVAGSAAPVKTANEGGSRSVGMFDNVPGGAGAVVAVVSLVAVLLVVRS